MSVNGVKNTAKNDEKSLIFEYLATPKSQYFDLPKNKFLTSSETSESELIELMPNMP